MLTITIGNRPVPAGAPAQPAAQWISGGIVGRVQDVLNRKGQVILYGPPGTGKTYWAERAASNLAALWNFGEEFDLVDEGKRTQIVGPSSDAFVQFCSFHPGYGYEDFIEGYRPGLVNGTLHFERQACSRDCAAPPRAIRARGTT